MNEPRKGLCLQITVKRIIDGDTIEIELIREFDVRLLDIDVYEKRTALGKRAIEFLTKLFETAKDIKLFIPSNKSRELMDINSFSRILGEIWVDGENLSTILKVKGYQKE